MGARKGAYKIKDKVANIMMIRLNTATFAFFMKKLIQIKTVETVIAMKCGNTKAVMIKAKNEAESLYLSKILL